MASAILTCQSHSSTVCNGDPKTLFNYIFLFTEFEYWFGRSVKKPIISSGVFSGSMSHLLIISIPFIWCKTVIWLNILLNLMLLCVYTPTRCFFTRSSTIMTLSWLYIALTRRIHSKLFIYACFRSHNTPSTFWCLLTSLEPNLIFSWVSCEVIGSLLGFFFIGSNVTKSVWIGLVWITRTSVVKPSISLRQEPKRKKYRYPKWWIGMALHFLG